jgi:hypothetical protein
MKIETLKRGMECRFYTAIKEPGAKNYTQEHPDINFS